MANNYCLSSSFIPVEEDKIERAKQIVLRAITKLENSEDGFVGYEAEVEEKGVWIHSDEYLTPEHAVELVQDLVEELDLPGIHVVSWAYTCSKPRIDEFGGGAFAVQKGKDVVRIDAAYAARKGAEALSTKETD